jgi:peptidoglycan/xylan/chitin deacetylase (PgdA/CDA1 family)
MFARTLRVLTVAPLAASLLVACAVESDEDDFRVEDMIELDYTDASCSGTRVPDRNGFAKRVALTFDDGPKLDTTPVVLDLLKARGIQATFLINGGKVTSDAHRALLARMVAEGHLLGNHTHTHVDATAVSDATLRAEIEKTDAVLRAAGVTPRFFRFPYGASNCATAQTVRSYGYSVLGWHIDTADWCFASGKGTCPKSTFQYVPDEYRDDMVGLTVAQVKVTNGGVVLFHDIHANTVNQLGAILDALTDEGFSFTNVDDASVFPKLNGQDAALPPFVGTSCTKDEACAFEGGYCLAASTATGVCSRPCDGYCADADGYAETFCAAVNPSQGTCLPKAAPENQGCKLLPGTAPVELPRFVEKSGAPASKDTVCLPQ